MSDLPESQPAPETPPPVAPEPVLVPVQPTGTATGLSPSVCAGLAMLFPLVGGLVFYVLEPKNAYTRFYSLQSIALGAVAVVVNVVATIASIVFASIPVLGWFLGILFWIVLMILGLAFLVVFILGVVKAFTGVEWEIPWLGKYARAYQKTGKLPFAA